MSNNDAYDKLARYSENQLDEHAHVCNDLAHWEHLYTAPYAHAKQVAVSTFIRAYLHRLLKRHHGCVSAAARDAGLERSALQRLLRNHDVPAKAYRPGK